MSLEIKNQNNLTTHINTRPTVQKEIKNLVGVLWYEMLSSMNEAGLSTTTLGSGDSNFKSMFLWNIAENDFGKYDTGLLNAALRQIGGASTQAPAVALPQPVQTSLQPPEIIHIFQQKLTENIPQDPHNLVVQATDFVKSVWPEVKAAAKILGVPAVAVLAQTALETGWGSAVPGYNLFGIKATAGEAGTVRATHEMIDGVLTPTIADFRAYRSKDESISDYVSLIKTAYPDVIDQNSVAGFATALQNGGYATDQGYARKIEQIAKSSLMSHVLKSVEAMN